MTVHMCGMGEKEEMGIQLLETENTGGGTG